jgi:hypothetical protein
LRGLLFHSCRTKRIDSPLLLDSAAENYKVQRSVTSSELDLYGSGLLTFITYQLNEVSDGTLRYWCLNMKHSRSVFVSHVKRTAF